MGLFISPYFIQCVSCCPHGLLPGDHIFKRIQSLFTADGYLEEHGIYLGDVILDCGVMIYNAIAFYSWNCNNPISIQPFDTFTQGSSISCIKYPSNISKPAQEVVNTCIKFANGKICVRDYNFSSGVNISEDFASLCKVGYAISTSIYKLCNDVITGNYPKLAIDLFLMGWVFYKQCIRSGQLHLCLSTIVKKIKEYKKANIGKGFRRIFFDEGKEHPYCSRSHSAQGNTQGISPENVVKPDDRCAIPGCWKPKSIEDGVTHHFCSKSHRKKAEAMGSKLVIDPNAQCDLPGCNMPKLVENSGTQQDYCSKSHAEQDTPRRDGESTMMIDDEYISGLVSADEYNRGICLSRI
ncbi:hypothetical protein LOD99_12838 [Oopsacas minuta]|uniref:Uncharacterized protein n=1 Tax=Oopsacas minuta TaxID=111878 RepID=A0AAV7JD59_9METZ|nr:hypothetical protein LOD99_12838 [Oopsacas minuta]